MWHHHAGEARVIVVASRRVSMMVFARDLIRDMPQMIAEPIILARWRTVGANTHNGHLRVSSKRTRRAGDVRHSLVSAAVLHGCIHCQPRTSETPHSARRFGLRTVEPALGVGKRGHPTAVPAPKTGANNENGLDRGGDLPVPLKVRLHPRRPDKASFIPTHPPIDVVENVGAHGQLRGADGGTAANETACTITCSQLRAADPMTSNVIRCVTRRSEPMLTAGTNERRG
jgi:hypothetical protein